MPIARPLTSICPERSSWRGVMAGLGHRARTLTGCPAGTGLHSMPTSTPLTSAKRSPRCAERASMTWWRTTVAKVNLEYVNSFTDRHGHKRYYFRKGGKRYSISGAPGTAVFAEAYDKL